MSDQLFERFRVASPAILELGGPTRLFRDNRLFVDGGGHIVAAQLGLDPSATGALPVPTYQVVAGIASAGAFESINVTVPAGVAWRVLAASCWSENGVGVFNPVPDLVLGLFAARGNPPVMPVFGGGAVNVPPTPVVGNPVMTWLGASEPVGGSLVVSARVPFVLEVGDTVNAMGTIGAGDNLRLGLLFSEWPAGRPPL